MRDKVTQQLPSIASRNTHVQKCYRVLVRMNVVPTFAPVGMCKLVAAYLLDIV